MRPFLPRPYGVPEFTRILEFARAKLFPLHWGVRGFAVNVDLGGTHVALCFGYRPVSVCWQSI